MNTQVSEAIIQALPPSSGDEKKLLARLILQKILSSAVVPYFSDTLHKELSTLFLSDAPDRDISLVLKNPSARDSYYSNICSASIVWEQSKDEIQDLDGNVWVTYSVKVTPEINSMYSSPFEAFQLRIAVFNALNDLLVDIKEMMSRPIRVLHLNNEQRVRRDKQRKDDAAIVGFRHLLITSGRELRRNLRVGGKSRSVAAHHVSLFDPGTYTFELNDGSKNRPRYKKYSLMIPENPNYHAYIRRVS